MHKYNISFTKTRLFYIFFVTLHHKTIEEIIREFLLPIY